VLGKKQIVARTALDLEAALKIPAEFWMNLEIAYQLTKARLERERRPKAAARARA
jgi:plasmid maintenance system antidote protein VapI